MLKNHYMNPRSVKIVAALPGISETRTTMEGFGVALNVGRYSDEER